jgi:hypothetical protein
MNPEEMLNRNDSGPQFNQQAGLSPTARGELLGGSPQPDGTTVNVLPVGGGNILTSPTNTTEQSQWPIEALVGLLDSGREELRAYRSQFYGSLAAAFLIPLATIAMPKTDYLEYGHCAFMLALVFTWIMGAVLLLRGTWLIGPKFMMHWGTTTEATILTQLDMALNGPPHTTLLIKSINDQHSLLKNTTKSSRFFTWAMAMFLICAGLLFAGFAVSQINHHYQGEHHNQPKQVQPLEGSSSS